MRSAVIATGLQFPEGPAYDSAGNLFFANCSSGAISRLTPEFELTEFVNTGGTPAAIAFDSADRLYVTESGRQAVLRIGLDGESEVYADRYTDGRRFRGTNDLVFAADGTLYVTDPKGSNLEEPVGDILRLPPGGPAERLAAGLAFPNGIALDASGRRLFVAETYHNRILVIDLADGGPPELFCQLTGGLGPDGMALDVDGNVYAAHYGNGCLALIAPDGRLLDQLPVDDPNPTNCCFGGWDGLSLVVTASKTNRVLELAVGVAGQPLHRPVVG